MGLVQGSVDVRCEERSGGCLLGIFRNPKATLNFDCSVLFQGKLINMTNSRRHA